MFQKFCFVLKLSQDIWFPRKSSFFFTMFVRMSTTCPGCYDINDIIIYYKNGCFLSKIYYLSSSSDHLHHIYIYIYIYHTYGVEKQQYFRQRIQYIMILNIVTRVTFIYLIHFSSFLHSGYQVNEG